MKNIIKNKYINFILIVLWVIGVGFWSFKLSDFKFKEKITTNDEITIIFLIIFLVIILYVSYKLWQISNVVEDLKRATVILNQLHKKGKESFDDVKDSFINEKLKSLYKKYRDETNRLQKDLPGGVGCDIEEFFNEENLAACIHDDKLNQIPGTFTGVGMIGTFVGLSIGLAGFELTSINVKDISPLMSSIKVAFITSILGLFFSIIFNFLFRNEIENLSSSIVDFINAHHTVAKDDSHNQINKLLEVQERQKDLLKSFPDMIIRAIATRLEPLIGQMESTYDHACDKLKDAQIQGMEKLMDEFTDKLIGTLIDTAKELTTSIKETRDYQIQSTEILEKNISSLTELTGKSVELNKLTENAVLNIKEYTDTLHKYLSELQNTIGINTKTVNESVQGFEKISTNHLELLDKSTNELNEISKTNITCAEKLSQSVEIIVQTCQKSLTDMNNCSQELVVLYKKMDESMEDKAKKHEKVYKQNLDALNTISKKNSKCIETIGKSIDSLSQTYEGIKTNMNDNSLEFIEAYKEANGKLTEISNKLITETQNFEEIHRKKIETLNEMSKNFEKTISISLNNATKSIENRTKSVVEKKCEEINRHAKENIVNIISESTKKSANESINRAVDENIKKIDSVMLKSNENHERKKQQ